jgi:hypothetical protein
MLSWAEYLSRLRETEDILAENYKEKDYLINLGID